MRKKPVEKATAAPMRSNREYSLAKIARMSPVVAPLILRIAMALRRSSQS